MSAVLPTSLDSQRLEPDGAALARDADKGKEDPPNPSDRAVSAVARLALSRERLRDAMLPPPRSAESSSGGNLGAMASRLMERIKDMPGATVLVEAVEAWWAQHPLRTVSRLGAEGARRLVGPIAERKPMTLVLGAVAVGALLALFKPWRLALRPALLAGLLPALLVRVLREVPIDTLFRTASSFGKTAASTAWSTATSPEEAAAEAAAALRRTTESMNPPRSAPATTPSAAAMQP